MTPYGNLLVCTGEFFWKAWARLQGTYKRPHNSTYNPFEKSLLASLCQREEFPSLKKPVLSFIDERG
jgi:hypothetical protein